ncbi:MAG: FAD-dependent thymidylate synthase [Candidatus Dormibacteraceae bacterium]
MASPAGSEFTAAESALLGRYFTNMERPVFALRNLPEVVKGALFSRYSRTEKSLRRVLLEEFVNAPETGFGALADDSPRGVEDLVAARRAEEFYERVLVGYGDDSVAELAGAHLACEQTSLLAAKALEDSRIGISPLEKSTRYVRFDRAGPDGRFLYLRAQELAHPAYEPAMERLFTAYSAMVAPLTERVRAEHPVEKDESERAWKAATRARALDLLRGLLPASTLTNLGLFGNGRAFEYLVTKLAGHELPECRRLAEALHRELSAVIPSFVRRALDDRHGLPAAARIGRMREALSLIAPREPRAPAPAAVRLVEHDPDAERKVLRAALFGRSDMPLDEVAGGEDLDRVMDVIMGDRANRRQRAPRALEHATYTFEIVANFAAYRDLHRHRMLSQDRQALGTRLGYEVPAEMERLGFGARFRDAVDGAATAQRRLEDDLGPDLAQYAVPIAFRLRWYVRANLREVYHLCELRTTPQGHPDYRFVAQEMFRRVQEVHPRLARHASFVDMGAGDELERRQGERRIDERRARLAR